LIKKWTEINAPWFEIERFPQLVESKINIIDVLGLLKLEYSQSRSGEFTHRMRCPFKIHADGEERTPSLFMSQDTNSFYCYGCHSHGTFINFIMYYLGCPYFKAIEWVVEATGMMGGDIQKALENLPIRERMDPEKTIETWVFRIGNDVRNYLNSLKGKNKYNTELFWADTKIYPKLDYIMDEFSDKDWERVKKYHDKIKKYMGVI